MKHLLIVEDDLTFSTMLATWLRKKGFDVCTASSVGAAVKRWLSEEPLPDLVLSDLRLPDHDGLYFLQWLHKQGHHVPFIVMTGYAEVDNAVEAMKLGATDYISKPIQPDILLGKLQDALEKPVSSQESVSPAKAAPTVSKQARGGQRTDVPAIQGIEGHSAAARELYQLASLVAPTPMSVLIMGASGTGKEYVARRIHGQSQRADGPFIALDCGALTKELAASELFGHVKGAFTGAGSDKVGAFEQASGGTLFLDEVGNLSYDVQVQLLRALQERRIRPVGSAEERTVDIRLVSATNENLPEAIARGAWREDLYHRINEFTLHMPLLRERIEDIPDFARYFLDRANEELGSNVRGFTPEALQLLQGYPWPGNLREMRNVIVRAALLSQQAGIIAPVALNLVQPAVSFVPALSIKPSPADEKERILQALKQTGGNKSRAAQLLGIDRKTLYNKLRQLGL